METINKITSECYNNIQTIIQNIRTEYQSELIQDATLFSYTDPNEAPNGSLERRIQDLSFKMSSAVTSLLVDIDDGLI